MSEVNDDDEGDDDGIDKVSLNACLCFTRSVLCFTRSALIIIS